MDENRFEKITKEVMKGYPGFSYNISKSAKSSSMYLYITDEFGLIRSLRVSDHKNGYNRSYNTEIVFPNVKDQVLRRTIVNLCKSLERKRVRYLMNKVSLQLSQSMAIWKIILISMTIYQNMLYCK